MQQWTTLRTNHLPTYFFQAWATISLFFFYRSELPFLKCFRDCVAKRCYNNLTIFNSCKSYKFFISKIQSEWVWLTENWGTQKKIMLQLCNHIFTNDVSSYVRSGGGLFDGQWLAPVLLLNQTFCNNLCLPLTKLQWHPINQNKKTACSGSSSL